MQVSKYKAESKGKLSPPLLLGMSVSMGPYSQSLRSLGKRGIWGPNWNRRQQKTKPLALRVWAQRWHPECHWGQFPEGIHITSPHRGGDTTSGNVQKWGLIPWSPSFPTENLSCQRAPQSCCHNANLKSSINSFPPPKMLHFKVYPPASISI